VSSSDRKNKLIPHQFWEFRNILSHNILSQRKKIVFRDCGSYSNSHHVSYIIRCSNYFQRHPWSRKKDGVSSSLSKNGFVRRCLLPSSPHQFWELRNLLTRSKERAFSDCGPLENSARQRAYIACGL